LPSTNRATPSVPHRPPDCRHDGDVPRQGGVEGFHPPRPPDLDLERADAARPVQQPCRLAGNHLDRVLGRRAAEVGEALPLLRRQQVLHVERGVVDRDAVPHPPAEQVGDGPAHRLGQQIEQGDVGAGEAVEQRGVPRGDAAHRVAVPLE